MASVSDIALLKEYIEIPLLSRPRTDPDLSAIIDEEGTVNAAAQRIWRVHAASLASLVDTAESGSSRKQSDLYKNALAVASSFDSADVLEGRLGPRSHAITRGDVVT